MQRNLITLVLALLALALLLMSGCDRWDCLGGTTESKDKAYKGEKGAIESYQEVVKDLWTVPAGEGGYFVTVTIWVHNPTNREVVADVTCKLKFDGGSSTTGDTTVSSEYIASKNARKSVHVKGMSSKRVTIKHNVSITQPERLVADCTTTFK